jgi:hypothetical protein
MKIVFFLLLILPFRIYGQNQHSQNLAPSTNTEKPTTARTSQEIFNRIVDEDLNIESRIEALNSLPADYFLNNPESLSQMLDLLIKNERPSSISLSRAIQSVLSKLQDKKGHLVAIEAAFKKLNLSLLKKNPLTDAERSALLPLLELIRQASGKKLAKMPDLFFQQNGLGPNIYEFLIEGTLSTKDFYLASSLSGLLQKMQLENTYKDSANSSPASRIIKVKMTQEAATISKNPSAEYLLDLYFESLNPNTELEKMRPYFESPTRRVFVKATEIMNNWPQQKKDTLGDVFIGTYRKHLISLLDKKENQRRDWKYDPTDSNPVSDLEIAQKSEDLALRGLKALAEHRQDVQALEELTKILPLYNPPEKNLSKTELGNYEFDSSRYLDYLAYYSDYSKKAESSLAFSKTFSNLSQEDKDLLTKKIARMMTLSTKKNTLKKAGHLLGLITESYLPKNLNRGDLQLSEPIIKPEVFKKVSTYIDKKPKLDREMREEIIRYDQMSSEERDKIPQSEKFRIESNRLLTQMSEDQVIKMTIMNSLHPEFYEKSLLPDIDPNSGSTRSDLGLLFSGLGVTFFGLAAPQVFVEARATYVSRENDPLVPTRIDIATADEIAKKLKTLRTEYEKTDDKQVSRK